MKWGGITGLDSREVCWSDRKLAKVGPELNPEIRFRIEFREILGSGLGRVDEN